jgi:hypothetical protein
MGKLLRFSFKEGETRESVEADIALAIFTAECVYGRPRVRMETSYLVDEGGKTCVVEVCGEAGETAARIFAGLAAARLGEHGYEVRRLPQPVGAPLTPGGSRLEEP